MAVILFTLFKASQLTELKIETEITVNAALDSVFMLVADQRHFYKWSPFLYKNPQLKYEIKGAGAMVGTQLHWIGDETNRDIGYQEIIKLDSPLFISIKCDVKKPFTSQSVFNYTFSGNSRSATVKQSFEMKSSLRSAVFLWILGAKSDIETTNELGLELLRKVLEEP
jgi:hypothetical protein